MSDIFNDLIKIKRSYVPSMKIEICDYLPTEPVQKKRHKRKSSRRWQKKWRKRFGTKQVVNTTYQLGDTLYVSQEMFDQVKKKLSDDVSQFQERQTLRLWGIGRELF